ncbi:DUF3093 domain-containing protein [Humibacter sp. BT305]|nr:DUF3093 domain-containing protein [Humibacter sp. BT305]
MASYRERLVPSPWIFIATALLIPASMVVFAPIEGIGFALGAGIGVVLYAGVIGTLVGTAPVIEVAEGELRAGRAHIPVGLVSDVQGFDGSDAALERGRRLDARAYLCIRGWITPVVKATIADPQDPTPYWLVSTRRPGDLKKAVEAARSSAV